MTKAVNILSDALNKMATDDEDKMFQPSQNKYEDFKVGNKVMLFHYWMMEDAPIGKVTLIKKRWAKKDRDILGFTTQYWTVKFDDGHVSDNWFKSDTPI
jgi:hypothetical protein